MVITAMGNHQKKQIVVKANASPAALCTYPLSCRMQARFSDEACKARLGTVYMKAKSGVPPAQRCMQWAQIHSVCHQLIQ